MAVIENGNGNVTWDFADLENKGLRLPIRQILKIKQEAPEIHEGIWESCSS